RFDRQGAAVHRRGRLAPDAADRPCRPARAARPAQRAAGAVRRMTALAALRPDEQVLVEMAEPDDFAGWRERARARALVQGGVPPERVSWIEAGASGS